MVSLLIRLLALIGLLWTGKQVAHQISSAVHPGQNAENKMAEDGPGSEMVHDPVCQTYIPKSLAVQKTIHGKPVYFCGHECAAKFVNQQDE
jgi:YHS domain-containing protein